jgi:hypothetical protein
MNEAAKRRTKFDPRFRVGQRQRGPSSTPSDEEGFIHGAWTDAKGSGVRISKNLREQLEPVQGCQPANAREHVLELKGLGKKAISAGIEARLAHLGFSVRSHY